MIADMDRQPKYLPQRESRFFSNGATMQTPVEGTIARGELQEDQPFYTGMSKGRYTANPLEVTEELLARGRERYAIYCSPCHGIQADGQSPMSDRGGVMITNLLDERIQEMEDGKIFETISRGSGLMPPHGYLIGVKDRWAIVAWVRDLQKGGRTQ